MFLAKPHVTGPEGQVTSPDVIVDVLIVDGIRQPLARLTHECWQQGGPDISCVAAYALTAIGGGALISPGLVVSDGRVILARVAWRLNTLDAHIGSVTLNGQTVSDLGHPALHITAAGGEGDVLPRGYLVVKTAPGPTVHATLSDPVMGRTLDHRATFEPLEDDRWGADRPHPRYSVGPTQKDVTHYI